MTIISGGGTYNRPNYYRYYNGILVTTSVGYVNDLGTVVQNHLFFAPNGETISSFDPQVSIAPTGTVTGLNPGGTSNYYVAANIYSIFGVTLTNRGTITNPGGNPKYLTPDGIEVHVDTVYTPSFIHLKTYDPSYYVDKITNFGLVQSVDGVAIDARSGLVLNNESGGRILGGVAFASGTQITTITNAGQIAGEAGIELTYGGTITNTTSGLIDGSTYRGISDQFGKTTIFNQGEIAGNQVGAYLYRGAITNQYSGLISGQLGVYFSYPGGMITNAGEIHGSKASIYLLGSGTLTNLRTGMVSGGTSGVVVKLGHAASQSGQGVVTNAGTILGQAYGIDNKPGGVLVNQPGGTIQAGTAVWFEDGSATVTNGGLISGQLGTGLGMGFGGTVTNTAYGTIVGANFGITNVWDDPLPPPAAIVTNAGTISGGIDGAYLTTGTVTNKYSGVIASQDWGVYVIDASGLVVNAGSISGAAKYGVRVNQGQVTNLSTGRITSGLNGVQAVGGGQVSNAGYIQGTSHGISLPSGGAVTNLSTGTIKSANVGVYAKLAPGTVTNAGTIEAPLGVWLVADGTLTNQSGGSIGGGNLGVVLSSLANVTNGGKIAGNSYAVVLEDGGQVTNQTYGTLSSSNDGLFAESTAATVTNKGLITAGSDGIELAKGGAVTNQSSGVIAAVSRGLDIRANASVVNAGVIAGLNNDGVDLDAGGSLTNAQSGVITGGQLGVYAQTAALAVTTAGSISAGRDGIYLRAGGAVTNTGTVSGSQVGVYLQDGGSVSNQSGGTLTGGKVGLKITAAAGTVSNAGEIEGNVTSVSGQPAVVTSGIDLLDGGTVTNQSTGIIAGASYGIYVSRLASGTIINAGSISGGTYALQFGAGAVGQVVIDPGAVFTGTVSGGNTIGATVSSTLELGSGAGTGQLTGLGTQFIDFAQIAEDAGAAWTLNGANTLAAGTTLTNAGALTVVNGALTDAGTIVNNDLIQDSTTLTVGTLTGAGHVSIGADGTLIATGAVAATETVALDGASLLDIVPSTFLGQINGLGAGGQIELTGITDATSASIIAGATLAITQAAGPTIDLAVNPAQNYAGIAFAIGTFGGANVITSVEQLGPTVISGGETEALSGAVAGLLAADGNGTGGITVTGAGSELTTTSAFPVGDTTLGALAIQAGGTVVSAAGATIANTAGASGTSANVIGSGSNWQITGALTVGDAGFGQLDIAQAATVWASGLDLGAAAGGSGAISIVGAGSELLVSGLATIGDLGPSTVSILNDGTLHTQDLNVGTGSVTGALTVDGSPAGQTARQEMLAGSEPLYVSNNMTVGALGVFQLGAGVIVHIANNFVENGQVIQGAGSRIDPTTVTNTTKSGGGGAAGIDGSVSITNSSTYFAGESYNGEYDISTPDLIGTGVLEVGALTTNPAGAIGNLQLDTGIVASTQTVNFVGGPAELTIGQDIDSPLATAPLAIGGFGAVVGSFNATDTIVVDTYVPTNFVLNGSVISVEDVGTNVLEGTIGFANATLADLAFNTAGALQDQIACFLEGTSILTRSGPCPVEHLKEGDEVVTRLGGPGRVVWVGHRTIDCTRHPRPETVWPFRIAAGAFEPGVPARELYLSPDHAVSRDGVLVPVKLLTNGATIQQIRRPRVTYYHVELARHDVLLAENLPAETYLDTGNRAMFENAGQPLSLHPDLSTGAEGRETLSCLPFVDRPEQTEPIWRELAARAVSLGWALPDSPETTDDPDLHLIIGGRRVNPVIAAGGRYSFVVPPGAETVRLVSRVGSPNDGRPWVADDRRLGVKVARLTMRTRDDVRAIAIDDPALAEEWHDVEWTGGAPGRWTAGDAPLPRAEAGILIVELAGTLRYRTAATPMLRRVA